VAAVQKTPRRTLLAKSEVKRTGPSGILQDYVASGETDSHDNAARRIARFPDRRYRCLRRRVGSRTRGEW